jgi:hypothetical protein
VRPYRLSMFLKSLAASDITRQKDLVFGKINYLANMVK